MNQNPVQPPHERKGGDIFTTTGWTVVLKAKKGSETALNSFCTTYHSALLAWLRCQGTKPYDAEDLVQGFLARLTKRDFLSNVSREKGRLRSFLLAALKNYVADQDAKARTRKRGGGRLLQSLDETDGQGQRIRDEPDRTASPDEAFDRAWAQATLAKSLERLRQECARTGHEALYSALEPALFADEQALAHAQIAGKLDMSEGAVKMAASRIRKRLSGIIREEVSQTLAKENELEDELRYLRSLFGKVNITE